jgi:signal transduction histidine kinase/CHASE1-domain containing sensor protein
MESMTPPLHPAGSNPEASIRVVAAVAVAYLVLGALGMWFAIPPGYASPIFPAAGFAVAAMLFWGGKAWPGVWVGSLALNLGTPWFYGNLSPGTALVAVAIASGSTLQAVAARQLVVRWVANAWRDLETGRDVALTLLLAGPLACVISASTGATALAMAGIVPGESYFYSWLNWWSGDTLGVLVMLPLSLMFLQLTQASWRGRLTTVGIPMLVALMAVGLAFMVVSRWERNQQKQEIQDHGEHLARLLEQRFVAHQEALAALRRVMEVTPDITHPQFEYFTRITLQDNPDIFALSINSFVTEDHRATYERVMASRTGNPGFQITERTSAGQLVRAGKRPEYVAVSYIAPLAGNLPAVGFDINSEPVRRQAIQHAIATRKTAVTPPLQLVQENRKRVGMLVLHPAYGKPATDKFSAAGDQLIGFSVGVIKVDELVEIATRSALVQDLVFELSDELAAPDRVRLYRSSSVEVSPDDFYVARERLAIADRVWTLKVMPTSDYLMRGQHWPAFFVGAIGLALAALLQTLLLVTTGSTAAVQRKVNEQTAELNSKTIALEDRNTQLDALLRLSPDGFVAFSHDGMVKYANPALQAMTGIPTRDILNQPQTVFEAELRRRCRTPDSFTGIATYFAQDEPGKPPKRLVLNIPQQVVLGIVGIRTTSSGIARILYLRNISHEAEVDRLKSEFLAHAAHELRTPMSSIYGFSELLLAMDLDEATRRELLESIHHQTRLLVDIINELLDLARIEARQGIDLKFADIELGDLVRRTVADLAVNLEKCVVCFDLPAGAIRVRVDEAKLRQALINILGNACKYSPDGSEIRICIAGNERWAEIRVSDHGIGMTPDQVRHFGERFWRADASGKTPGTGLGVAIVKEILNLLGGRLDVQSAYGEGTTVTLWLPTVPE